MQRTIHRWYFPAISILLLALTLVGFGDNLITDVGQPSNSDPKFVIHGLMCGAWMILLAAQSLLISNGNVALHRKIGLAAMAVAIGVTLSTLWVFVAVWKGWAAMSPEVKANRLFLPSYAVFVILAFRNRRRPDWHKRLILAATFFMLAPVLGRVYDPLIVDPFMTQLSEAQIEAAFLPWLFSVWIGFLLSMVLYDAIVVHRIHVVTTSALILFGTVWAVAYIT